MERNDIVKSVGEALYTDEFRNLFKKSIAYRTDSQNSEFHDELYHYLNGFITPWLKDMGFEISVFSEYSPEGSPFLIASRIESPEYTTVLSYGHGDVVPGDEANWRHGLNPWELNISEDIWFGRGSADNKGQHLVNLFALQKMIEIKKGKLGFNFKLLLEMGEENGSPGLHRFCRDHAERLKADLFIASDGPRLNAQSATLFLGSRGVVNLTLKVDLRKKVYHSGNWGGLLRNPAIILSNAIASVMDETGCCKIPELLPGGIPPEIRAEIVDLPVGGQPGDPDIDSDWGGEALSAGEKLFGWNTFEVLAMKAGNPEKPAHAIPSQAIAHCHMRYVTGTDPECFVPAIQAHLSKKGFKEVSVAVDRSHAMKATRLELTHPGVKWIVESMKKTTGSPPVILPNLGGSIPNDAFSEILNLPTLWIPHSYPACSQHAPDEHNLGSVLYEGLSIMAGIYWDLGEMTGTVKDFNV